MKTNVQASRQGPLVSVIMANWRGERYLAEAIGSVLGQSISDVELLVADDASDDRSQEIIREAMTSDSRVRLLASPDNAGPSDARNRALDVAQGEWVAIMDSDDLIHPRRLELLLGAAQRFDADMIADDLAFFGATPGVGGRTLLTSLNLTAAMPVSTALFVDSNNESNRLPNLGYLKPLIRRRALADLRYDTRIRVGEDYDFYLRVLLQGLRFVLLPLPLYLYRRHPKSLSHRLSVQALEPLLAAHDAVTNSVPAEPTLARALSSRGRSLRRALRYEHLVAAIKSRSFNKAMALVLRDPLLLRHLATSFMEHRARRSAPPVPERTAAPARIALVPAGHELPPLVDGGAARDGTFTVQPLRIDRLDVAPQILSISCRLTELAAHRPLDITVMGLEGLDALGLVPNWRTAEVWLTKAEEAALLTPLPAGARLQRLPS